MSSPLRVAVIGAGPAGLVAARELQREGFIVVVYEKSDQLGGTWVYTACTETDPLGLDPNREIVHSSLYKSLCTNLPRPLMGFSDYPFPLHRNGDSMSNFPRHEEVLDFLNEFARDFGLVELIKFNSEVVRVYLRDDQWVVESRTSWESRSEEFAFDAVVVCNGHCTQPRLAELPGVWHGKEIHSHNYRFPEPFQNLVVVVVGDGPSAYDISNEIAGAAKEVHLSSRSRDIKLQQFDHKNIWQHKKIERVHESGEVLFQDGTSVLADFILHCTGYKYHFPFLETNGTVIVDDNRVGQLYKHVFPPKLAPRLSFIGLPYGVIIFLMLELQSKWVAKVLSMKLLLPSEQEMLAEVDEHYRTMEETGIPKHHTHRLLPLELEYLDWLAAQVGLVSVDDQVKELWRSLHNVLATDGWVGLRKWDVKNVIQ